MLDRIVQTKKEEMKSFKMPRDSRSTRPYSLKKALLNPSHQIGLIAEIKKASPSKGVFSHDFQPGHIAAKYIQGEADALSVLTDRTYFQGELRYIKNLRNKVDIPILRKDFIIDRRQIEESDRIGADVMLLIAAILEPAQLREYYSEIYERGMEAIVEVHSEKDFEKTIDLNPEIIGINNRDLTTFETDVRHTLSHLPNISNDTLVISESGIRTKSDIDLLSKAGVKGVLVGETLMREKDPCQAISKLFNGAASL